MSGARSYSLSGLVEATGFDRRTIVYYIQSGLLPKVGRRGPHTRYPEECLTRLLFIKGVKGLQAEGQLLTATLAEIRRALAALNPAAIGDLLNRGLPVDDLTALFSADTVPAPEQPPPPMPAIEPVRGPAGERRSYGLADAGIRKRFAADRAPAPFPPDAPVPESTAVQPASPPPSPVTVAGTGDQAAIAEPELGELLRELELRPTLNARRSPPGAPEQWTEIPITSRVYLSVRGLSEDDVPLAESVARLLKRALRNRGAAAAP